MPSLKRQRPLEEDRDEVESESESSQASDSLDEEGNETDASEELIDAAKRAQTTKGKSVCLNSFHYFTTLSVRNHLLRTQEGPFA